MPRLRRAAAPLAVLLLLLVGGEGADLLPCADADCGLWGWVLGADGHADAPTEAPGDTACVCHAVYVPPAAVPAAVAGRAPAGALHAEAPAPLVPGPGRVPVPPPRG